MFAAGGKSGHMNAASGSEQLGDWLRRQRKASGLTQEELAERSGVSARAIANLERARTRKPYPNSLRSLVRALDLPEDVSAALIRRYRLDDSEPVGPHSEAGSGPAREGAIHDFAGPVPRQLPAAPGPFIGRVSELAELDRLLDEMMGQEAGSVVISAIRGTAGVGKTALALHWAHRVAARFPGGQLYANLHGYDPSGVPATTGETIRGFLHSLEPDHARIPLSVDEQAGLYRSLLAGKRMLVLLDNAIDAAQVRPLLPGAPGCLVLVTSRSQLSGLVALNGARVLNLDLLTSAEALSLLTSRLGTGRTSVEPGSVEDLSRSCARLPLALCIAAARAGALPGVSLAAIAAELRDSRDPLDALSAGEPAADVRAVFSWSYKSLGSQASRVFRLLSLHPGPEIDRVVTASLAGASVAAASAALGDLVQAGLVTECVPGRYALHDLLRAYSVGEARIADSQEERRSALRRMLDHYLQTARAADATLYPAIWSIEFDQPLDATVPGEFASHEQAFSWFKAERPVLLKLIDDAHASGFGSYSWKLAWVIRRFLYAGGYPHDLLKAQNTALAAVHRSGSRDGLAHTHLTLGRACTYVGEYEEADKNLKQAIAIFREDGHHVGEAYANLALGYLMEIQHQYLAGLPFAQRAIDLSEEFPADPHMRAVRANATNNSGWLHACAGEFREAQARSEQALALYREAGNAEGAATALDSLGYVCTRIGEHARAIEYFGESLQLLSVHGNRYKAAEALEHLAETHQAAGDIPAAQETLRQALAIYEGLNHPRAAMIRADIGDLGG
jgi:transcriptional regulator with XRE-family HTH domain/tetratricopeptide (TPR) repeat protein